MKNQETLGFILSVASQESSIEKANVNWTGIFKANIVGMCYYLRLCKHKNSVNVKMDKLI